MLVAMESKFVSFCLDNYSAHLGNCPKAIIEIRTSLRDNENRKQDEDNIVVTNDGEYAGWRISRAQSPNLESHVVLGKSSLGGCGEEIPSTCEPSCVDWSTLWPGTMSCEFGDNQSNVLGWMGHKQLQQHPRPYKITWVGTAELHWARKLPRIQVASSQPSKSACGGGASLY